MTDNTATAPADKPKRPRRPAATLPPTLHPEQRIAFPELCALAGAGKTLAFELIKKGELPEPERYGARCVRWRAGDVIEALQRRAAAHRDAAPIDNGAKVAMAAAASVAARRAKRTEVA